LAVGNSGSVAGNSALVVALVAGNSALVVALVVSSGRVGSGAGRSDLMGRAGCDGASRLTEIV
jgi:hypothetical protein